MAFRVLLDACVLAPIQLCDLLLRLAEAGLYQPVWSEEILGEVERTLVSKLGRSSSQAQRRVGQMRQAFGLATVTGYEDLIPSMTNHPKDRHVLAAAVRGQAACIVTANLNDFPAGALAPYDLEVLHPDAFLQDQLDLDSDRTLRCLIEQRTAYVKPRMSGAEFYGTLRRTVPDFAVRAHLEEMDPAERARFVGHLNMGSTVWEFLKTVVQRRDLRAAWPVIDPDLRRAMAERWLAANGAALRTGGFVSQQVADEFVTNMPNHELWPHFERVQVRQLTEALPNPAVWVMGTETRLIASDVELVYIHDSREMPEGVWRPGERRWQFPVLMRWNGDQWMILNLGSDTGP